MKNEEKYKIIIAHPAQQHSFKTVVAIKQVGLLDKYITTVYNRKYSLTAFIKFFLKGDSKIKLAAHRCNEIQDSDVIQFCEFTSIILLILSRIDRKRKLCGLLNEYIIRKFNIFSTC